jgi:hypothetical protein
MNNSIKTTRKDHGPFISVTKTIKATLKHGSATLTCDTQKGITPMGRRYCMKPRWWIKYDGSPCAMGPWKAEGIRKYFAA